MESTQVLFGFVLCNDHTRKRFHRSRFFAFLPSRGRSGSPLLPCRGLPGRHCQRTDPPYHARKQPRCEMALGQH
jgi:hypothetical protein